MEYLIIKAGAQVIDLKWVRQLTTVYYYAGYTSFRF